MSDVEGLRATVDALLGCLPLSDDGTGHVADCDYTEDSPTCGCYALPGRLADIIADRIQAARAEALEEARDALYRGEGPDLVADGDIVYGEWLDARAAALRADDAGGEGL